MENRNDLQGDSNIILQGMDSSQVNLTVNNISTENTSPEVKELKEALKEKLHALLDRLDDLQDNFENREKAAPEKPDAAMLKEVKTLLKAIRAERCVLFIGPEISRESEDSDLSLHEQKFRELAEDDLSDLVYNTEDGFFDPHDDPLFEVDVQEYYADNFPDENTFGKEILTRLLGLPFRLIVNMTPDESVHRVFQTYDRDHNFEYFKEDTEFADIKPESDKPLVINVLGSAVSNGGKYIFTTSDFYNYIKSAELSPEVKSELKNAAHLLFIGFDFSKWYTRLLLFMLGTEGKSRRTHLTKEEHPRVKEYLEKQFSLTEVPASYSDFVDNTLALAEKIKIGKDLPLFFLEKQMAKILGIADRVADADKLVPLREIEEDIKSLKQKISVYESAC